MKRVIINKIPTILIEPQTITQDTKLVIWLPGLTMCKEDLIENLNDLSSMGFLAISIDAWQHGERKVDNSPEEMIERIFSNFYNNMWPILGQTVLNIKEIIDHILKAYNISNKVFIGGLSMGGDIAIATAILDKRISCIASMCSTPDWKRPGMKDYNNPELLMETGNPDSYATSFYNQFDPITHLDSYSYLPPISFECGEIDFHVPVDGAIQFKNKLLKFYKNEPEKININIHKNTGHQSTAEMWQNCKNWFRKYDIK